jgi:hypothetical protein
MENDKRVLSRDLLELDFFNALGTVQFYKANTFGNFVKAGVPYAYDYHGGVHVVYDEKGCPWVRHRKSFKDDHDAQNVVQSLFERYNLQDGAPVPHANDGGWFMLKALPVLLAGRDDTTHEFRVKLLSRKEEGEV